MLDCGIVFKRNGDNFLILSLIRSRTAGPPSPIGWEKEFICGTITRGGVLTPGYFLSALQAFNL
jgi:hypothetical protein